MTFIELTGHVNEKGELEFPKPANLPPGEVRIIIETFDAEAEAADEALWEAQFAASQDILERLSQEAHEDFLMGRTEDCDNLDAI